MIKVVPSPHDACGPDRGPNFYWTNETSELDGVLCYAKDCKFHRKSSEEAAMEEAKEDLAKTVVPGTEIGAFPIDAALGYWSQVPDSWTEEQITEHVTRAGLCFVDCYWDTSGDKKKIFVNAPVFAARVKAV